MKGNETINGQKEHEIRDPTMTIRNVHYTLNYQQRESVPFENNTKNIFLSAR